MSELLASTLTAEPETKRCPECKGLGWVPVYKFEPDGNLYTLAPDCPECKGAKRVLREGTPIERRARR